MKSDLGPPWNRFPLVIALWGLILVGGLVCYWVWWDNPPDPISFGSYASAVLSGLPATFLVLLATVSLFSALALSVISKKMLAGGRGTKAVVGLFLVVSTAFGGNAGLWVFGSPSSPAAETSPSCSYDVYLDAGVPAAWSHQTRTVVASAPNGDLGALVNGLPKSNRVICFAAGNYSIYSTIRVSHQSNVSLLFFPGAVLTAVATTGLLAIGFSTGVTVDGGRWVGAGHGNFSDIEIDRGSNKVVVQRVDASLAGRDGILIRNDTTPALQVSILNNYLHNNLRFGAQDFENRTSQSLNILISGNRAEDNRRGGIYTNGAGGVHIVGNSVRNTVGRLPGMIGIGVTNGANDTVTGNHVEKMGEYGIQVFYNNNTLVANNYSAFNGGYSDQSGITNDHSFYDTIVNNTAVSNGLAGIHVERSWYVTVTGNNATGNGRFGIEFYHGTLTATAYMTVVGNICSRNGQAGIIFNSGLDSIVASNRCLDNSGPGVFLYNDQGQVGSSGNIIANNTLGDDRAAPTSRSQPYGVEAVNGADNNIVEGNIFFGNTVANISLVGTSNIVRSNVEGP